MLVAMVVVATMIMIHNHLLSWFMPLSLKRMLKMKEQKIQQV